MGIHVPYLCWMVAILLNMLRVAFHCCLFSMECSCLWLFSVEVLEQLSEGVVAACVVATVRSTQIMVVLLLVQVRPVKVSRKLEQRSDVKQCTNVMQAVMTHLGGIHESMFLSMHMHKYSTCFVI